jgi:YaiO family outer membrane protein
VRTVLLAGAFALALASPALAQPAAAPPASTYDQAVQDRLAGRLDKAIPELRALSQSAPMDADVWLNLGLALTAKGDFDGAEAALSKGLDVSPKYDDLRVAYARLAYFRQHPAEARQRLAPVLSNGPPNPDAQDLLKQIGAAEREAMGLPWRVDVSASYSALNQGVEPWREWDLSVGRKIDAYSAFSVGIEETSRFGIRNNYAHVEYSRRFGQWGAFVGYGGSWDALYRPRNFVQGGINTPAVPIGAGWSLNGEVDASYGDYTTGGVTSVQPMLTLAHGDLFALSARYVSTFAPQGQTIGGYILRGDLSPLSYLHLNVGYADAPDSSAGVTIKQRTWSGGVALDVTDSTTVRIDGAHEIGPFLIRDNYALGLTQRF